ncbi:MAG: DNA helicase RecQ [Blautia sp.]|nr:DNA helicase RecQ [Blautia sp.]
MTAKQILKQTFGYDEFRPGQKQVIDAILSGRDVLAVMPTGAGKSICYQVPALLLPGITLVISPLISLMQDQVKALNAAGIHAAYINSSLSENQIRRALRLAQLGTYKIIYVAPERLESYDFMDFSSSAGISMVTVDEAHCISQWGQDFRRSYLKIIDFIGRLDTRPVISAFTATATAEVKEDIRCMLSLKDPLILTTGFDRPNLYFDVETGVKKDEYVLKYLRDHGTESGIVYCATRKNVDDLYALLKSKGIKVSRYHAGMPVTDRKESQDDFVYDRTLVMLATNAFGMGIDKSNVRFVIHYNMPQSMENYYQEAGRAGRDGESASCVLLFSGQDLVIDRYLLEKKDFSQVNPEDIEMIKERDQHRLRIMENYCRTTDCLRNTILRYFGEKSTTPCGNCRNCSQSFVEKDMTAQAIQILRCVQEAGQRFGVAIITGALIGAKRARLQEINAFSWQSYGSIRDIKENMLRDLIRQMAQEGFLHLTQDRYSVVRFGPRARDLAKGNATVSLRLPENQVIETGEPQVSRKARQTDNLTSWGYRLFEELRELRTQIAREENLPPYIIFADKTLVDMCVKAPDSDWQMLQVSGVGKVKNEKYGGRFLQLIQEFKADHPMQALSLGTAQWDGREDERTSGNKEKIVTETAEMLSEQSRAKKKAFLLTPDQASGFVYADSCSVSEIVGMLNELRDEAQVKAVQTKDITSFLMERNLLKEVTENGRTRRLPSQEGLQLGILMESRVSKDGKPYQIVLYPEAIQKLIVEHFISHPAK